MPANTSLCVMQGRPAERETCSVRHDGKSNPDLTTGDDAAQRRHRVAIVGAGSGGPFAANALRRAEVDVTVGDRTNHHLFQPLLYQMATRILAEGDIAPPIRDIPRREGNILETCLYSATSTCCRPQASRNARNPSMHPTA